MKKYEKKIIIIGAGNRGREAVKRYGKDNVAFFCDNDKEKWESLIEGIIVHPLDKLRDLNCNDFIILITPRNPYYLACQLENMGIRDYLLLQDYDLEIVDYEIEKEDETNRKHNSFLSDYVRKSSEVDLLVSVANFIEISREAICLAKKGGFPLNYYTRGEESTRYGNLNALLEYANLDYSEFDYLPIISHVDSLPYYSASFIYRTAVVFSGSYYRDHIHKWFPWVPVFSVGPYIHYAKGIYDRLKLRETKEHFGKMALAFLPHTLENTVRGYSRKQFIDKVTECYSESYDSIWLCVYFADLTSEVCEYAELKGIHVVSAGFRFDPQFDSRLKTMFDLADAVICGDIGTFVTYALYYNLPIGKVDIKDDTTVFEMQFEDSNELRVEMTDDYITFENRFESLFDSTPRFTSEQKKWMNPIGGFDEVRDKDYIRDIFQISRRIWSISGGDLREYPNAVRKAYYLYNKEDDIVSLDILKSSVGSYLD